MATEQVRMRRPVADDRVLLMAGRTAHYAIEPRGEYVFGVISHQPMQSRRGQERRLVRPGQLVAWDPSGAHAGTAVDGRAWSARLMIVQGAGLAALATDQEADVLRDVVFPEPVISDPFLARGFRDLHAALEAPASRLERDGRLAEWLRALIERSAPGRPKRLPVSDRDDQALSRALDYLRDQPARNVSLDELAIAAGIGKFRLVRLFRQRTGLPPHALQLAYRIQSARRLLEAGQPIAEAAATAGFADQSHLHRHFQRGLGVTPAEYQRRLGL